MNKSIIMIGIATTLCLSQAVIATGKYTINVNPIFISFPSTAGKIIISNNAGAKDEDNDKCDTGPYSFELSQNSGAQVIQNFKHCNGHTHTDGSHVRFHAQIYQGDYYCGFLTWLSDGTSVSWHPDDGNTCIFFEYEGFDTPYLMPDQDGCDNGNDANCIIDITIPYQG